MTISNTDLAILRGFSLAPVSGQGCGSDAPTFPDVSLFLAIIDCALWQSMLPTNRMMARMEILSFVESYLSTELTMRNEK